MAIVEMIVNMDCHGCERKVRRALQKVDGVESIDIDMNLQKVTVTGLVDQEKVLTKVRKTGKKAELWPFPYNAEDVGFTQQYADLYTYHSDPTTYFHIEQPQTSTYNYYEHRYNGHDHVLYQEFPPSTSFHVLYQEFPPSTSFSESASIAFNDENVNACYVM